MPAENNTPQTPHEYDRRILLLVTGKTPQVVTETLYALATEEPAFIPTEIHLITTEEGRNDAKVALLADPDASEEAGWFHRLVKDYQLRGIQFDESHIHVIHDANGNALPDIRTDEQNQIAADLITQHVQRFTADPNCALHVSLAGGRKTMTYYLGLAINLFARPQDRLSHVLVDSPFETHPDFFYPTIKTRSILNKHNGRYYDCKQAKVTLAQVPLLRLRDQLPEELTEFEHGQMRFSDVVKAAQLALEPARVLLDYRRETIVLHDGSHIRLTPADLAFYGWILRRQKNGQAGPDRPHPASHDWSSSQRARYEQFYKEHSDEWRYADVAKNTGSKMDEDKAMLASYFDQRRRSINAALKKQASFLAERYLIDNKPGPGYRTRIEPNRIRIINE